MASFEEVMWTVIWFILLVAVCWPVGFVCAVLYVLLQPFFPCCKGCDGFRDILHKGLQLPQTAAVNMMNAKSGC